MQLNENDWSRMDARPIDTHLYKIGSFVDHGCTETLYMGSDHGSLYRNRSWSSRIAESGDVWFVFLGSD